MFFNSDGNTSTGVLGWLRMFSTNSPQIQLKGTEDILIMTIQEQQKIFEDKVTDINNLKSEMASLRAMIEDIKSKK